MRDMFSSPPATITSASPHSSCWAADQIDWSPLPHRRLTVKAGTDSAMPAASETRRAL